MALRDPHVPTGPPAMDKKTSTQPDDTTAKADPPAATPITSEEAKVITKQLNDMDARLKELAKPQYPPGLIEMLARGQAPHGTSGPIAPDKGFSILKAAGYCLGVLNADQCKEEREVDAKLKALLGGEYKAHYQGRAFFVPASTEFLPVTHPDGSLNSDAVKFAGELRQKMQATVRGFDPEEAAYIRRKAAWANPMGTVSDTAGGSLVGFPALGEVIDLQRNLEVFTRAGATEVTLPANGRISFPKLTGGATAYNVGEAAAITESKETTGSLLLEGKKIGVLVPINNELLRYVGPSSEGMIRNDMAQVAALKADLDMLQGTGGTQIKGLINYPAQPTWVPNVDKLIAHVSVGDPGNANLGFKFQPEDVALMLGKLPDAVDGATSWIVRKDWFAYLINRRADAVAANDGKGPFVFDVWRSIAENKTTTDVAGAKVVRSRQVPNNRVRGSSTDNTLALAGNFPDWLIARFGVMEFMANPYGDQAMVNDQTVLRAIQILDAGPRHAASFVMCDQLAFA